MADVRRANVEAKCRLIIDSLKDVRSKNTTPEEVCVRLTDVINRCETISTNLNPTKVALYGALGVGKSRFINMLLGTIVCNEGGTNKSTAVLSEIVSRDHMKNFKATVRFTSVRAMKERLEYVAESLKEDRHRGDQRYSAICSMMQHCFKSELSYQNPGPLEPRDGSNVLIANIGRPPLQLESNTMRDLLVALAPYTTLPTDPYAPPNEWQAMTVDSIRIEGHFEHLPSNVVMVDSPGLFDAVEMKSQRALDALDTWQHIWYADTSGRILQEAQKQVAFKHLCATQQRMRRVSMVCTKADSCMMDEEAVAEFDHEAMAVQALQTIDRVLFYGNEEDIRRDIRLPIGFVSLPRRAEDRFGINFWRQKLIALGVEQETTLKAMEQALQDVISMLGGLGVQDTPPNFPVDALDTLVNGTKSAIDKLMNAYLNAFSGPNENVTRLYEIIKRNGIWGDIRWNTWRAARDMYRRGIFSGKGIRPYIDINTDISGAWVRSLDKDINAVEQHYAAFRNDICNLSAHWPGAPAGFDHSVGIDVARWRNRTSDIMNRAFDAATLAVQIRNDLTNAGTYNGQRCCPTQQELDVEVIRLLNMQRVYHGQLVNELAALRNAIMRSSQGMQGLNIDTQNMIKDLITTLQRLPNQDQFYLSEDSIPVDFICPLKLDIMSDPVLLEDGCVFERWYIENYFASCKSVLCCPLDRNLIQRGHIFPHPLLKRRITLWMERNRFEEPGEWWMGMWEDIVAGLQEAHAEHAVEPDAVEREEA